MSKSLRLIALTTLCAALSLAGAASASASSVTSYGQLSCVQGSALIGSGQPGSFGSVTATAPKTVLTHSSEAYAPQLQVYSSGAWRNVSLGQWGTKRPLASVWRLSNGNALYSQRFTVNSGAYYAVLTWV